MLTAVLRFCLLVSLTASMCEALAPLLPTGRRVTGCTAIGATQLLEDSVDASTAMPRSSLTPQSTTSLPSWVHLPASRRDVDLTELQSTELVIGRLAMFGAVGLIGKEIMTGESFLEQFASMFPHFSSAM